MDKTHQKLSLIAQNGARHLLHAASWAALFVIAACTSNPSQRASTPNQPPGVIVLARGSGAPLPQLKPIYRCDIRTRYVDHEELVTLRVRFFTGNPPTMYFSEFQEHESTHRLARQRFLADGDLHEININGQEKLQYSVDVQGTVITLATTMPESPRHPFIKLSIDASNPDLLAVTTRESGTEESGDKPKIVEGMGNCQPD